MDTRQRVVLGALCAAVLITAAVFAAQLFAPVPHVRGPLEVAFGRDCPSLPASAPSGAVSSADSITLTRTGCDGPCPEYDVRVSGDGKVAWEGRFSTAVADKAEARILPGEAVKLLERFQTDAVWGLCDRYEADTSDLAGSSVAINIGGRAKRVVDYAMAAPEWFRALESAIDETADTHRFRHGDPASEPLLNAQVEYLPKPGITALMRAAAANDVGTIRSLLAKGASVDAADASGWTAVTYAGASSIFEKAPGALELLAAKGADLRHLSRHGDTVLMASSQSGQFPAGLVPRAGDINAQNVDGVTELMILADRAQPGQIPAALKAGARIDLRDAKGRIALDYLEAAKCRKNLLGRSPASTFVEVDKGCQAIEPNTYAEAKRLLTPK